MPPKYPLSGPSPAAEAIVKSSFQVISEQQQQQQQQKQTIRTPTPEQFAAARKAITQANEMGLTGGVYKSFVESALMKIPYR